jgi:DNA polymerase-3 subunit delta'
VTTGDPWGIVGHERAVELLRRAVQHRRIGHAYLISGPLGVGKRTLAVRLAQALNCERLGPGSGAVPHPNPLPEGEGALPPSPSQGLGDTGMSARSAALPRGPSPVAQPIFAPGTGHGRSDGGAGGGGLLEPPCGACRRCRLIAADAHPEVRVVGVQPPHRLIRVADVESIQADAALRAADVYRKVYVLEQAELLHPDAANRLLKTIEEPPPSVVMILTTVDPEATLETIVSRCQHLRLRPLPRGRLAQHLVDVAGLSSERADLLAALSEGCVGRALTLASDHGALERRSRLMDEMVELLDADRVARLQYARTLGDRWSRDPDGVREVPGTWLRWWRDVLLLQGGLDERIVNLDRRQTLERLARVLSASEVAAAVGSARDVLQMLDQNVNARLALDVATLDLPRTDRAA